VTGEGKSFNSDECSESGDVKGRRRLEEGGIGLKKMDGAWIGFTGGAWMRRMDKWGEEVGCTEESKVLEKNRK